MGECYRILANVKKENDGEERTAQDTVSFRQNLWAPETFQAIELIQGHTRASRNGLTLQESQKYDTQVKCARATLKLFRIKLPSDHFLLSFKN